jgi:hypothetical protein
MNPNSNIWREADARRNAEQYFQLAVAVHQQIIWFLVRELDCNEHQHTHTHTHTLYALMCWISPHQIAMYDVSRVDVLEAAKDLIDNKLIMFFLQPNLRRYDL